MLLLWCDDKGLEIYYTARWNAPADALILARVWEKLEAYVTPRSNQILARYQLRCLKQDDKNLEKFITQTRRLVDDSGYTAATRDEMLRDTAVFGIKSDKFRRDAIGNNLTYKQVYDFAPKHRWSRSLATKLQLTSMLSEAGYPDATSKLHTSCKQSEVSKQPRSQPGKSRKACYKCGGDHGRKVQLVQEDRTLRSRLPSKATSSTRRGQQAVRRRLQLLYVSSRDDH